MHAGVRDSSARCSNGSARTWAAWRSPTPSRGSCRAPSRQVWRLRTSSRRWPSVVSERTVLALWGSIAPDAESARMLQRVRVAGPEGISPRDLLKALYSNTNRWRGRELVAAALDTGLLRKVPSGRGWRILAGAVVGEASLWQAVVRDAGRSPIVLDRSPMSPVEGSRRGSTAGRPSRPRAPGVPVRDPSRSLPRTPFPTSLAWTPTRRCRQKVPKTPPLPHMDTLRHHLVLRRASSLMGRRQLMRLCRETLLSPAREKGTTSRTSSMPPGPSSRGCSRTRRRSSRATGTTVGREGWSDVA